MFKIIIFTLIFIIWLLSYIYYLLVIRQYLILYAAGKMKTGNDFGEQLFLAKKEMNINYFKFYYKILKPKSED